MVYKCAITGLFINGGKISVNLHVLFINEGRISVKLHAANSDNKTHFPFNDGI